MRMCPPPGARGGGVPFRPRIASDGFRFLEGVSPTGHRFNFDPSGQGWRPPVLDKGYYPGRMEYIYTTIPFDPNRR